MKLKGLLFLIGGLLIGVLLGVLIVFGGSSNHQGAGQRIPPTIGSAVKDFTLEKLDGEPLKISGVRGKPLILNFWATWCPPCKEEMPLLAQYADAYSDQLVVIGVNYAEEKDLVERFVNEQNITFPILLDKSGTVADIYFVRNYPMTFFIDKDGVLRAQHLGQLTNDVMIRYLELIGITE
ncbi:MAG: TlpA family protein disulfide reductase [Anaerolineaceae bacterium]|nr:TlpA family protein disulfide reductase [Anaerolineaceae bacterium]